MMASRVDAMIIQAAELPVELRETMGMAPEEAVAVVRLDMLRDLFARVRQVHGVLATATTRGASDDGGGTAGEPGTDDGHGRAGASG